MSTRAVLALVGAISVASVAAAQGTEGGPADGSQTEARERFEAGTRAFEIGDYARAAQEFRAAYELTPHPDLLFNIYSALERQGDIPGAAEALEIYLRDGDPNDERRASLEARLARLRARLAEERAADAERQLAAEREAQRLAGEQRERAATEDHAPVESGGGVHPAGIGVLVGGGVLLASFGVFAGLAAAEDGNLTSSCGRSCSADEVATLQTFNLVADISWIAGAAAAATGLILLVALPPEGGSASAAFAPWVAPGAAGGTIAGRF